MAWLILSLTRKIFESYVWPSLSEFKKGEADVDIVPLLRSYGDKYQQDFQRIGVAYTVEGLQSAIVRADETHINSIFSNLILNAKDALEEVEADRPKEIRITVEKRDDATGSFFTVTVTDNGPGIPEDKLSDIFEPFYSTKPTTGTGLGLGVVKRLVQLYGSTIEVELAVGKGTPFKMTFLEMKPSG